MDPIDPMDPGDRSVKYVTTSKTNIPEKKSSIGEDEHLWKPTHL